MGIYKLETASRLLFNQILNSAAHQGRLLMNWNTQSKRLIASAARSKFEMRRQDQNLIAEFRGRLRHTEELIGKLGYALQELL